MKRIKILALFSMIVLPMLPMNLVRAGDSLPELTRYLKAELESASRSLDVAGEAVADEAYFLRRWMVRVQAPFGIKVPWVAKFQIVPEVELVWQRQYPEGWSEYKP